MLLWIEHVLGGNIMRSKKVWEASSSGPDWTDIAVSMKAVGDFHQVLIVLSLGPGAFDGPSLFGSLSATGIPAEGSVLGQPILGIGLEYPCKDHKDLTSCVFAAVLQMDFMLSDKLWHQLKLPFTAT